MKRIPLRHRFWCLCKGYVQFEEDCPWHRFKGDDWIILILNQPHYAERCPWEKLNADDWIDLLVTLPELHIHCDWKKIKSSSDWDFLLEYQPQFKEFRKS